MITEPAFIWPGNKRMHLDHVLPHIPLNTTRFVDVFGGSGTVLINTPFHQLDVFNDTNSHVFNFFRVLQKKKEELIEKLELSVHSRELFNTYMEERDDETLSPVDRAAAWFYTIETSFSRLGRHYGRNMQASFETRRVYERIKHFEGVHLRIRHAFIEHKDWAEIVNDYDDPETVFYMDPPYIDTQCGTYKTGNIDHPLLMKVVSRIKGRVVMSGVPHELYDSQSFWSHRESWPAASRIKSDSRKNGRMECLWVKPSTGT